MVFRDNSATFIGGYSQNIGIADPKTVELCAAMWAIEKAMSMGWVNFWLESDSQTVVSAITASCVVPWIIGNRWHNCIHFFRILHGHCSHNLREGNAVADATGIRHMMHFIGIYIKCTLYVKESQI